MTDLHYLSATDALRLFRSRELSPVELLDAVIARAAEVEPTVNAFCFTFYDEARTAAKVAEARYAGTGEEPRPLEGIPLAIKDEEAIEGQHATQGSILLKDLISDHTSVFAQRMLDSGAIVHARTTAPEFTIASFTRSKLWGITRNPWNPKFAVGGSSGGSGAALAAGTTTLASGSDIGGSIRIPASFNGVVGYKPPYGRVPQDPPFNLDTFCSVGPLARTVADAALYQNCVVGPAFSDPASVSPKVLLPEHFAGVEGMRIALSVDLGAWPLDPEVRANTLAVGEALRSAGAIVDEVDLAISRQDLTRAGAIHFHLMVGSMVADLVAQHPEETTAYAAAMAEQVAEKAQGGTQLEEYTLSMEIAKPILSTLAEYDALICPTIASRGLLADEEYLRGTSVTVGGEELEFYFDMMMTVPFNILNRCPVLSVPSGFADNRVPTGVQIVGRAYDDETVFRIGSALERIRPWFDTADRRPNVIETLVA